MEHKNNIIFIMPNKVRGHMALAGDGAQEIDSGFHKAMIFRGRGVIMRSL